jgi:hypothetical protein
MSGGEVHPIKILFAMDVGLLHDSVCGWAAVAAYLPVSLLRCGTAPCSTVCCRAQAYAYCPHDERDIARKRGQFPAVALPFTGELSSRPE